MPFKNKHHKVSFSYHFIFNRIMCVLVTFQGRLHFAMLIIRNMHLINLHFWTYSISKGRAGVLFRTFQELKSGFSPSVPLRVVSLKRPTSLSSTFSGTFKDIAPNNVSVDSQFVVLESVSHGGEKKFKQHPQNIILVPFLFGVSDENVFTFASNFYPSLLLVW